VTYSNANRISLDCYREVGCSKKLTVGRPVKLSFRAGDLALCHVPEANGFGTIRQSTGPRGLLLKCKGGISPEIQ
jgi:hypothetical protein